MRAANKRTAIPRTLPRCKTAGEGSLLHDETIIAKIMAKVMAKVMIAKIIPDI
jgi:hypothetical protein